MEHGPGAPCDSDITRLEHLKRAHRGVCQVAQFMGKESEPFVPASGLSIDAGLSSFAPVLSDRARDGVVKAVVQRTKIIRADGSVHLDGQFGDRLTNIAVVMNDL